LALWKGFSNQKRNIHDLHMLDWFVILIPYTGVLCIIRLSFKLPEYYRGRIFLYYALTFVAWGTVPGPTTGGLERWMMLVSRWNS
jgi:hypothetical protein